MGPVSILLVDDDPLIRSLGKELLERLGYGVEVARDGAEAVKLYQGLGKVDLVILDYYLPGQDGGQVLETLRALDPEVRVLVASGFLAPQEVARLKQSGAGGIIHKPYRLAQLESRIKTVLQGGTAF